MKESYHQELHPLGNLGIQVSMAALDCPHIPMHWHDAMEILFCLNGQVTVHTERERFPLSHNQLAVFDAKEVHSISVSSPLYMFLCIHVDKKQLSVYCPDLEFYHIHCNPTCLSGLQAEAYEKLCHLAHALTRSNIKAEPADAMRSDGTALLMLADLIQFFSVYTPLTDAPSTPHSNDTIRRIISYVMQHYKDPITLEDMASETGFSKEYFCRFFKQHLNITFLQYVNEVRISHAGRLLSSTDLPIQEVMRESGFTNQTVFNRLFKETYGITPRQMRKADKNAEPWHTLP